MGTTAERMVASEQPAQLTFDQIAAIRPRIPTGLFVVLSHQEQLFVMHLLASANMSQAEAAIAAGYSKRRARQAGHELMRRERVKVAVDAAMAARIARLEVTADDVVNELRRIAFADPRRAMEWDGDGVRLIPSKELDDDTAHSIAEVSSRKRTALEGEREVTTTEIKLKHHDKGQALALLSKHTGVVGGDGSEREPEAQARTIRDHLDAMDAATVAA